MTKRFIYIFIKLLIICSLTTSGEANGDIGLSEEVKSVEESLKDFPERPAPLLEFGDSFLEPGAISRGFRLPTGAVWNPSFIAWGNYRTALQASYDGVDERVEWANRFDLFGNLYLTQTERILAGVRFLDQGGRFSGYTFSSPDRDGSGFDNEFNFDLTTLFFEGDFGEIFPDLDPEDMYGLDYAFAIGRQPLNYQEGILINDSVDSLGISRINLRPQGVVNHRATFLFGWNELNRKNLSSDNSNAEMYGFLNEIDFRKCTVALDALYIDSDNESGDGAYFGLSSVQRIGMLDTGFRLLTSTTVGNETEHNRDGVILFAELSLRNGLSKDNLYLNGFRAFNNFRSASRDPSVGGPLGRTGILFESAGMGRYASPLNNEADDAYGAALGYQAFFNNTRSQLVAELGGRYAMDEGQRAVGPGMRYQKAIGRRAVFRMDAFALYSENSILISPNSDDYNIGGRFEFLFKF